MSNSGDLLITEIFFLLLPAFMLLATMALIAYFYLRRFNKTIRRYKIQKLEEVENERKRIANDLHDFVAGKLITIKSELNESLHSSDDPRVYKSIAQGITDLNKFHDEIRHLVEYIYPKELLSGNIRQSFTRLAEEMSNSQTEVIMDMEFEHQLPKDKTHQLFRLLQEKISNILAYEKPPKIFIGLFENAEESEVMLTLSYNRNDHTTGILKKQRRPQGGRGTAVINERLKILRARFHADNTDGFYKETIIFPLH